MQHLAMKLAESLGAGVNLVSFDFEDAGTFAAAMEGVDKVFLLGPPMVVALDSLLAPFIDFLKAKGITRVVHVSALGMETLTELPFHTNVVDKLKEDGFDYTILKPTEL